jgi:hypothetical protein
VLESIRYRALMPRHFVVGDRYLPSSGRGGWAWPGRQWETAICGVRGPLWSKR